MGRSGVAFVAMLAATVSAGALGYSVFWTYQGETVARREAPPVQAPVVAAPRAQPVPIAPPAPVVAPPVVTAPGVQPVPSAPRPAAEAAPRQAVVAPPPAAAAPPPPAAAPMTVATQPAPVAKSAPAAAPVVAPPPAPRAASVTPPVKSALAKPQGAARAVKAAPSHPVATENAPPRPEAAPPTATAEPPANPAAKPEAREPEPMRADAPTALHPGQPAREADTAAPQSTVPPAAKGEPPVMAPGPFAALPPSLDAATTDAATADAPAAEAPRASGVPREGPRTRRKLHHAPHRHLASLPPFILPSRPAVHQTHPIVILRGGPFARAPRTGTQSAAAALPGPRSGIQVMRGTRVRPIAGGSPGPLILRVQN